jgi:hypothetical protein
MFKEKTKMRKTLHCRMHKKGEKDSANFGKGESSQKISPVHKKGAKAPTQFMKVSKKGM